MGFRYSPPTFYKERHMTFKIDEEAIRKLAKLLDETNLTEIEITDGEDRAIRVNRAPAPIASAAPTLSVNAPIVTNTASAPAASTENPNAVKSPMVGTVYMSGSPGAAPFIEVGKSVKQGDTLLIVEAMKVMNPIKSPKGGTVKQIMVSDAQPVEFGQALVVIE
jgi:acetyl-CoA carboxylase biotin carboxyl carrier protein